MTTMKRTISLCLYPVLLALVILVPAACKKQPFLDSMALTPYLGMPSNLDQLHSIDLERLRAREGFQELVDKTIASDPQFKKVMAALVRQVEFNPIEQIDKIFVGVRAGAANAVNPLQNILLIAKGNFQNPAAKLEKLRQWLGEEYLITPPPFKANVHPGTSFKRFQMAAQSQYNEKVVYEFNFAFPSDTLMLFSLSQPLLGESLDVISGQAQGIQTDQYWQKMLDRPNIGAALWGTGNLSPSLFKNGPAAALGGGASAYANARQYYYDVQFGQDFTAQIGLVCDTIEGATQLSQALKGTLDQVKLLALAQSAKAPLTAKLPASILILSELQTAKISLKLSEEERRNLFDEWEKLSEKNAPAPSSPTPTPKP